MLSALRRRMSVTPSAVIATVALVFAMTGGAYAANKYLITSTKQIKPSVLKQLQGKAGKTGPAGASGAQGPAGTAGAKGANGTAGTNGTNGTNGAPGKDGTPGANGKSVEAFTIATGEPSCEGHGGAQYEVEGSGSADEICNGKEGEPWHVGGLPKGATETGTWTFDASEATADENDKVYVPISFSVSLRAPITEAGKVHFVPESGEPPCTGTVAKPTAPEGQLCIYRNELEGAAFLTILELEGIIHERASVAGAYLAFKEVHDHAAGRGSWAVTGN